MKSRFFPPLILLLMLVSCAQVRTVSGGEKDNDSPIVLFADPAFLSTNITPKKITLTFDEYIQLNNIQQELIVSPPLSHQPQIKIKGKTLELNFQDTLLTNTTYQINFGDGVGDVNENNKAQDLIFVFSTGSTIDSLTYSGSVHQFNSDESGKNFKVLLFQNDSAIFIKKSLPIYFAKSKDDGTFHLSYLTGGTYHLFALDDLNGNYTWDEGEAIAMHPDPVIVQPQDSSAVELASSIPRSAHPTVKEYITDSIGSVKLVIDPYYHDLKITSLSNKNFLTQSHSDTLQIWMNDSLTQEEELLRVQWQDHIDDTISVRTFPEATSKALPLWADKTKILIADDVEIQSSFPLSIVQDDAFVLDADSIIQPCQVVKGPSANSILVKSNWQPGKNYHLHVLPGALESIYGATNDTSEFHFSCYKPEELGVLNLNLNHLPLNTNCVFTLYNKTREIVYRKSNCIDEVITIPNLPAGEYSAELLRDDNNNGIFDPIDWKTGTSPERVFVYTGKMTVRANWDVKADWPVIN